MKIAVFLDDVDIETLSNVSVEAAFQLLTRTMKDPLNANVCITRFSLAAQRIQLELKGCTSQSEKIKFANSHPELLRAAMNFLTLSYSKDAHRLMLKTRMMECRCDLDLPGMDIMHQGVIGPFPPNGERLKNLHEETYVAVTTICNVIITTLDGLTQHKFRKPSVTQGEQNWPMDAGDLFPNGIAQTVEAFTLWVEDAQPRKGYIIYKLVTSLCAFYLPFKRAIFDVEQGSGYFFTCVTPMFYLGEIVKQADPSGTTSAFVSTLSFKEPLKAIMGFLQFQKDSDISNFSFVVNLQRQIYEPILNRLVEILSTFFPDSWDSIRELAAFMQASTKPTFTSWIDVERELCSSHFRYARFERIFHQLIDVRKSGCMSIKCPAVVMDAAVCSSLCGGCDLFRFCNKRVNDLSLHDIVDRANICEQQCQREAWKSGIPHRGICVFIREFINSLGDANWALFRSPDFTAEQFLEIILDKPELDSKVTELGMIITNIRFFQVKYKGEKESESMQSEEATLERAKWLDNNIRGVGEQYAKYFGFGMKDKANKDHTLSH